MNTIRQNNDQKLWIGALFPLVALGIVFSPSIRYLVDLWMVDENFSHAFFVPFISAYLIWQKREALAEQRLEGSWWGLLLVLAGIALALIGEMATLYVLLHFSLLIIIVGLILSAIGWQGLKIILFPVAFLFTMIRPPDFLLQSLSGELQLLSSRMAVAFDQAIGITAYREGNVIDFGTIQLQVAEACSGLRYLFPLSTLALILAYLFKEKFWKRLILFLSSIPISILLNGFRIGMTGLLVEHFGEAAAEGFFHSFSGWLLFTTGLSILLIEVSLLAGLFSRRNARRLGDLFQDSALKKSRSARTVISPVAKFKLSFPYWVSAACLIPLVIAFFSIVSRQEIIPDRKLFIDFPMAVSNWTGSPGKMGQEYIDTLKFDDYILADFRSGNDAPVNFYSAWYNSQKKGQSAHSPRTCIPGGGWEITSLAEQEIGEKDGSPIKVNRAIIQKGDQKQVVYYWFQQRGRVISNEYLVKFYLFWDAISRNRTDGALVRLTSIVNSGEDEKSADRRIAQFAENIGPLLNRFIPD